MLFRSPGQHGDSASREQGTHDCADAFGGAGPAGPLDVDDRVADEGAEDAAARALLRWVAGPVSNVDVNLMAMADFLQTEAGFQP